MTKQQRIEELEGQLAGCVGRARLLVLREQYALDYAAIGGAIQAIDHLLAETTSEGEGASALSP